MARRTLSEIYNAYDQERQNQTTLTGLQPSVDDVQTLLSDVNSPSQVADWRLWQFIHSVCTWILEGLWDVFQKEIDDKVASAHYGTARWFQKIALDFQLGYSLEWIDNKLVYADTTSNAAKAARIIKQCAVVETGGQVIIKVAKEVGGVLQKLSAGELSAFDAYIAKVEPAGCNRITQSSDPDQIKLELRVYYNPEVVYQDGFAFNGAGSQFPIRDAIEKYLSTLSFNGVLRLSEIERVIIDTGAYLQVSFINAQFKYGALPFTNIVDEYIPNAGYAVLDTLTWINYADVQS